MTYYHYTIIRRGIYQNSNNFLLGRVLIDKIFLPLSCCCCTAAAKLGCAPPRLETLDDANPVIDELKLVDVPDDIT